MTDEQMNECRQQLATIAVARKQMSNVATWLAKNKDLKGYDPYTRMMDMATDIVYAAEMLKFVQARLMCLMFPGGIPQEAK